MSLSEEEEDYDFVRTATDRQTDTWMDPEFYQFNDTKVRHTWKCSRTFSHTQEVNKKRTMTGKWKQGCWMRSSVSNGYVFWDTKF